MGNKDKGWIVLILAIVIGLAISFCCTAFLFWLACHAFGWEWTWRASLGIWAVLAIVRSIFRGSGKNG